VAPLSIDAHNEIRSLYEYCIYTSKEHFRTETKQQVKFFTNLSLNAYRKAICERYGFLGKNSIQHFEDHFDKTVAYLVVRETLDDISYRTAHLDHEQAISEFEHYKYHVFEKHTQLSFIVIEVNHADTLDQEIISMKLPDKQGANDDCYPYPFDTWRAIQKTFYQDGCYHEKLVNKDQAAALFKLAYISDCLVSSTLSKNMGDIRKYTTLQNAHLKDHCGTITFDMISLVGQNDMLRGIGHKSAP
jgi:hypothetical protein